MRFEHAVVAGGAGFLGSHLCDRLLAEGVRVTAIDNLVTGSLDNIAHLASEPKFDFVEADITEPLRITAKPDVVFNLASPASPVDYLELPIETLLAGSTGTLNTLEIARKNNCRYFLASTSEVYGDPTVHPQTEDYWGNVNPIGTRSCYDEAKRFAEAMTFAYRRKHNVDTVVIRIFNTYGPRMRIDDGRVVPTFLKQSLLREPITIFGDGRQTRSFCYVADEIDGIFRLASSTESGPINVGNPVELTMIQFADIIREVTGSDSRLKFVPLPTADDPMQRKPDITKARSLLGWEPKIMLREGIGLTIPFFKDKLKL